MDDQTTNTTSTANPYATEPTQYSNARTRATIENWPLGFRQKCVAQFKVEVNKRGERCARVTRANNSGRISKPKLGTYSHYVRIVDGSDGRTYIASYDMGAMLCIMRGDMKSDAETITPHDPRFAGLLADMKSVTPNQE